MPPNTNRTYYHDIFGKIEPDIESMVAYLIDEGVLFVSSAKDEFTDEKCLGLFILINDYFVSASDAESVTYDELPKLFESYKEKRHDGVAQFVANKRGIANKHWREEGSHFNQECIKHGV